MIYEEFFKEKRVLITGHTGFKGTWLTIILQRLGAIICGFSLPVDVGSFYYKVNPEISYHYEGNITDKEMLKEVFSDFKPEIIIHLASHSSLDKSYEIPDYILNTNIMGVVNLFECVAKVDSVKAVLIVTSDKCYKNIESNIPYKEENILGAQDPYSTSKACQELISDCYRNSFYNNIIGEWGTSVAIATARASNVIGPGDYNLTRLMPYLMNSFLSGEKVLIRNPKAIRPWQSVFDVLHGYLELAKNLYINCGINNKYCSPYNFGPNDEGFIKVEDVVLEFIKYFDDASYEFINVKNNETKILKLDSSKAIRDLNWNQNIPFKNIIRHMVEFSKRELNGEKLKDICNELIDKYYFEVLYGKS